MGVSALVGFWIVISNFEDLLAIVIEKKAVNHKPNLAWDSQKGGLFVRHGCCRRKWRLGFFGKTGLVVGI
jgi:hypothetical protein